MPTNLPERVVLEDDDRDTVYSFSDSCSTVSESPLTSQTGTSEPCPGAAAVSRGRGAVLRPVHLSLPHPTVTGDPEKVLVRAHVRWHVRRATALNGSPFASRTRSASSTAELHRTASTASTSYQTAATTTTTTPWMPLTCELAPPSTWRRRQRIVVDVGRALLRACAFPGADCAGRTAAETRLDRGARTMSADIQMDQFVLPTISRRHAQLAFVLTAPTATTVEGSADAGGEATVSIVSASSGSWACNAAEVTDFVSATTYRSVPLHPHHRYHLALHEAPPAAVPVLAEALGGGRPDRSKTAAPGTVSVALGLGRWCTVEVALETPAKPPSARRPAPTTRQTIYLDVDSTNVPTGSRDDDNEPSLHNTPSDPMLSLLSEMEPALLVRGKGRRLRDSAGTAPAKARRSSLATSAGTVAGRKRTAQAVEDNTTPPRARRSGTSDAGDAAHATVVFTTGMELSTSEARRLRAAQVRVNPPLAEAARAKVLVVQPPLNRSVKLLTVLPYVDAFVARPWLEEVLERRDASVPTSAFAYAEPKAPKGIEATNGFALADLLRVSPAQRQRLFSGLRFFVHRDATPQDPPSNDLKTVLTASGGRLSKTPDAANVVILPDTKPTKACWKSLSGALQKRAGQDSTLVVTRDDVFKCVLRQTRPTVSTVVPPAADTPTKSAAADSPPTRAPRKSSGSADTSATKAPRTRPSSRRSTSVKVPRKR